MMRHHVRRLRGPICFLRRTESYGQVSNYSELLVDVTTDPRIMDSAV